VKRLALVALAVFAFGTAPAHAATKEYSTGNVDIRIGAHLEEPLGVPDAGPVSFVRVSFRITTADTSALAISLVSPSGLVVPLFVHRGRGADFGSDEKGCGGISTVFESDETTNPVEAGKPPFTDNPYRSEGDLRSLYGEQARGRWRLRIGNDGGPATLHCLTLGISRAVPETLTSRRGAVRAAVGYVERNGFYERLRLEVVRAGRRVVDSPLARLCRDCETFRPVSVRVRDLDGGEPEVLAELYTQGAHCCTVVLALRYERSTHEYRPKLLFFGNYGYKLADLDHDGLPEISAFDERFIYTFSAYVFSSAPPRILRYRHGRLIDATRRFPAEIRRNARRVGKEFLKKTRPPKDVDLRTYAAVYVADQYLLGRPEEARRALDYALAHGFLYSGSEYLGTPAGRNFVTVLMRHLHKWGYIR
jgi:subtilisin-like proprotein convertase family protein